MTSNPHGPAPSPEVVPSGDPTPNAPEERPGTETAPEPEPQPVGEGAPSKLEGLPAEEDISPADAADRLDLDPEEQLNRPDQPGASPEERAQFDRPDDRSIADAEHPEDR